MLILSRKRGERIRIAHDIIIEVIAIDGSRARIGVDAARDVPVDREEIYQRRQRQLQGSQPSKL